MEQHSDAIDAIASLTDEVRRRLYEFARSSRQPVSRDEAASAVGISRKLAAFHLDKLVDAGLLTSDFDNASAMRGRPPKVYMTSDVGYAVSIPTRRHELLAEILAKGMVDEDQHGSARVGAVRAAYQRGVAAAQHVSGRVRRGRIGAERAWKLAEQVLVLNGFEPYHPASGRMRLRNCPFHPMAAAMPDLVCGLNHAFTSGVIAGLPTETVHAVLAPSAGECCVELRTGAAPGS